MTLEEEVAALRAEISALRMEVGNLRYQGPAPVYYWPAPVYRQHPYYPYIPHQPSWSGGTFTGQAIGIGYAGATC